MFSPLFIWRSLDSVQFSPNKPWFLRVERRWLREEVGRDLSQLLRFRQLQRRRAYVRAAARRLWSAPNIRQSALVTLGQLENNVLCKNLRFNAAAFQSFYLCSACNVQQLAQSAAEQVTAGGASTQLVVLRLHISKDICMFTHTHRRRTSYRTLVVLPKKTVVYRTQLFAG